MIRMEKSTISALVDFDMVYDLIVRDKNNNDWQKTANHYYFFMFLLLTLLLLLCFDAECCVWNGFKSFFCNQFASLTAHSVGFVFNSN